MQKRLLLLAISAIFQLAAAQPPETSRIGRFLTMILGIPESQLSPANIFFNALPALIKNGPEIAYACKENFMHYAASEELLWAYNLPPDSHEKIIGDHAQAVAALEALNAYARPIIRNKHAPGLLHEILSLLFKNYKTAAGSFLKDAQCTSPLEKALAFCNLLSQPFMPSALGTSALLDIATIQIQAARASNDPAHAIKLLLAIPLIRRLNKSRPLFRLIENLYSAEQLRTLLAKKSIKEIVVYSRTVPQAFREEEYIVLRSPLGIFIQQLGLLFEAPMHLYYINTGNHPHDFLAAATAAQEEVLACDAALSRIAEICHKPSQPQDVLKLATKRSLEGGSTQLRPVRRVGRLIQAIWPRTSPEDRRSLSRDNAQDDLNESLEKFTKLAKNPWIRTGYLNADNLLWKKFAFHILPLLPLCQQCYILKSDYDKLTPDTQEALATIATRQWLATMEHSVEFFVRAALPKP